MNNEEKILAMQEKHGELLEQLEERTQDLEARFQRSSAIQKEHSKLLEELYGTKEELGARLRRSDTIQEDHRSWSERVDERIKELEARSQRSDAILKEHSALLKQLDERAEDLDARSLRTAVLLETEIIRNIRLIFEGQKLLEQKMDELVPKERVETLEGEVSVQKSTIKTMLKRLDALEKAQ